jgi:hypothetical protein
LGSHHSRFSEIRFGESRFNLTERGPPQLPIAAQEEKLVFGMHFAFLPQQMRYLAPGKRIAGHV